ncbi:MAG: hypothetical protein PVG39_29715 [Desulfobacteraceae bacterium]|jgi:hypothetical protein
MSKYKINFICIHFTLALIFCPLFSFAEWKGPEEIILGTWGENSDQFYFDPQDTTALFPKDIAVDKDGNIIIRDEGNRRILIYNTNGILKNVIKKPTELPATDSLFFWPTEFKLLPNNNIVILCGYEKLSGGIRPLQQCFLNYDGIITKKIDMGELFTADNGYILLKKDIYYAYTLSGQLLNTYTEPPLELGVVDERRLGDGRYKVTVKYPGKEWVITGKGACEKYIRIGDCELYCIGQMQIVQYDEKGNERSRLTMPENNIQQIPIPGDGVESHINVLEEYGPPVVSPIGDVYTWKRTPDTYSIIKWVWVDGPDSPRSLKGSSSADSVTLTWEVPDEAADKVKVYEITRSTDVCGPYNVIGKVKKDIHTYVDKEVKKGEIYYYKVRASMEEGYSGYSNKTVGKI